MKSVCTLLALTGLTVSSAFAQSNDAVADSGDGEMVVPELTPQVPNYELNTRTFVFPSGLTVYMQEDHSQPMVAITTVFDEGSTADPAGKEGIAHFVEHFWFKSRHFRSRDEDGNDIIDEETGRNVDEGPRTWDVLSEMGCGLNASTSNDWTNYMTICPKSALKPLVKLASLRMTDAVGGTYPDEVESEREVIRNELRMRMENGGGEALRYIYDRVYEPSHPYHRMTIGTHSSLDNVSHADIVQFTKDHYRPENATIVIVGDFELEEAASLLFENMDPSLLHPDLKEEHIAWVPRPGVSRADIDPENPDPDMVYWTAIDPASPEGSPQPFRLVDEIPVRASEFGITPGPAYNTETGVFDAPIDDRTVIVGWSAPGGYQGADTVARIAANMAGNQIMNGVWDDPRVNRMVINDEVTEIPDVGCWASPDKENTTIMCFMGIKQSAPGERMAELMIDQLPEMWNPEILANPMFRRSYENSFSLAKMDIMSDTLMSLDRVAGLYGARATDIAMHAHFTGSPTYHSDVMTEMGGFSIDEAVTFARTFMTRDRAAKVVLNPIPLDERTLDSSESDYAGATAENDLVVSALDPDAITPELIRSQVDLPDLDAIIEETLPNGLRVVIMPHGEAPLVEAHYISHGGYGLDTVGMDSWAEGYFNDARLFTNDNGRPTIDPLRIAGQWGDTGNYQFSTMGVRAPSGNVDGALYLLRERRGESTVAYRKVGKKVKKGRSRLARNWRKQSYWEEEVIWETMGVDHPAFHTMQWNDWNQRAEMEKDEIISYLTQKYSPQNSSLLIVGNIDPQEALEHARMYFGDLSGPEATHPSFTVPEPAPIHEAEPMIYLFDDPAKTQTETAFYCRLSSASTEDDAARGVATQMLSDHLFETLRAREGVTYGAYASSRAVVGDTGYFTMGGLIQNDAAALAAKTYLQVAEDAAAGDFPMERFRPTQLSVARKYVLGQQSVGQMTGRLAGVIGNGQDWTKISEFPERLASVDMDHMTRLLSTCPDTAVMTMVGPVEVLEAQLEEAGLAYETFDHEARAMELLTEFDPKGAKKYAKYLAEKAEAEAEAEAERAAADEEADEGVDE